MASNTFILRCKTEKGTYTLDELSGECTVQKLKMSISKCTEIDARNVKILCGYPPKALNPESNNMKLYEVNIHSGDTIIVETLKVPQVSSDKPDEVKDENPATEDLIQDVLPGIMMRHVVPSNNSCLFTSIYFLLSNGDTSVDKSMDLRRIIADIVRSDTTKYNDAYLGMSNRNYCAWIVNPDHWGGAIELAILSVHFKLEIVAVDTLSLNLHRFGESCNFRNRGFLIYDGIHYDPLILELENDRRTLFPTSDPRPMELVLELAREAKSSRQFTDVANFTLRCQVCKITLQGDKEARIHAQETGHVEFGEL